MTRPTRIPPSHSAPGSTTVVGPGALARVTGDGALTMPAPTLRTLAPRFLQWFRFVRERSHNTILGYTFDLKMFVDFAEAQGLVTPDAVRVQHLEAFTAWLRQERKLAASSVNRHIHALRTFWRWMQREEIVTRNPAADVALLKAPRRLPVYLSIAEQERLLGVLALPFPPRHKSRYPSDLKWTRTWRRDHALIATALFCGLRVGELSTLRAADVDLDAGVLRIVGKGDKERECVIISRLAAILRDYITTTRPILMARRPSDFLFIATMKGAVLRGPHWRLDRPIPPRNLYMIISRRVEAILKRPCHPHMLRHSFASRLRENNAGIELIQEALGHADIRTTMIYSHLSTSKRKADIARYLEGESS
jgi:integrase/recombinase XerD